MTILFEQRRSDSPLLETVTQGYTPCAGSTIRPAECNWHLVIVNREGQPWIPSGIHLSLSAGCASP